MLHHYTRTPPVVADRSPSLNHFPSVRWSGKDARNVPISDPGSSSVSQPGNVRASPVPFLSKYSYPVSTILQFTGDGIIFYGNIYG